MILEIGDWRFDIDIEATVKHSATEAREHCDCAYCRNYYAAVDAAYPQLRPFLAQFGVDIAAPEELFSFTKNEYIGIYAVNGVILETGEGIQVDGISIEIGHDEPINIRCPEPNFTISTDLMTLPWVLEESIEEPSVEVCFPAKRPSFLKRMWNKLFGKDESKIES